MGPAFPDVTVLLGDPTLADGAKPDGRFAAVDLEAYARLKQALASLPGYRFEYVECHRDLLGRLVAAPPAFVWNGCDTGYRNDARLELHLPALFELLDVPYTGAGPRCLALCEDKALVRAIARDLGIRVPAELALGPRDPLPEQLPRELLPAVVKPNRADGSLGITRAAVAHDLAGVRQRIAELRRELPDRGVLVQEFLTGGEYGVALIGNPGADLAALPLLEVDYACLDPDLPRLLTYESKAVPSSPYWQRIGYRQAHLPAAAEDRLVAWSVALFERLCCRDYARFDYRAGADGAVRLLEVNPNPAWCWDGKLNLMAGFAGLSYAELLRRMLVAGGERLATRQEAACVPV